MGIKSSDGQVDDWIVDIVQIYTNIHVLTLMKRCVLAGSFVFHLVAMIDFSMDK